MVVEMVVVAIIWSSGVGYMIDFLGLKTLM